MDPAAIHYQPEDLATPGARFVGRFVDNLVLLVPLGICIFVGIDTRHPIPFVLLGVAIWLGIQWFSFRGTGRTLGKRVSGTRVLRLDGTPVGFVRGFLGRDLLILVANATRILGIINALMIFGAERRCGHDRVLGTVVVDAAKAAERGIDAERVAEVFR